MDQLTLRLALLRVQWYGNNSNIMCCMDDCSISLGLLAFSQKTQSLLDIITFGECSLRNHFLNLSFYWLLEFTKNDFEKCQKSNFKKFTNQKCNGNNNN